MVCPFQFGKLIHTVYLYEPESGSSAEFIHYRCTDMDSSSVCNTPQDRLTLSAELRNIIHERNILTTRTRMKVLSALEDINKTSSDEKQKSLRAKAIEEILTSEVTYLQQLELIMKYFMEPLRGMKCISQATFSALFGHIETLYKVNGELLYELKLNPKNVAAAFFKLAPFFKLYSVYAYDYKNVLVILQDLQNNNSELGKFIQDQENCPEVNTKLASLLITPIQRVPRYRLLLKEVLSMTPPAHPDYVTLQGSLVEVEKAAVHINSLVQEQENMQKMIQMQKSLKNGRPSIIAPGRKLLKEGLLMKVSPHAKKAHSRYFILFNDLLMYCKLLRTVASLPNSLCCCCVLPLKKCTIEEILSRGMFKITCQHETFLLYSSVPEESESWITALKQAISQYHESRQTLRKDSSARRPMRGSDLVMEINPFQTLKGTRKRRRMSITQDSGEISSTSCETGNIQSYLEQHEELHSDKENYGFASPGPKDSLYPLRESLCKRRKVNDLIKEVDETYFMNGLTNISSPKSDDAGTVNPCGANTSRSTWPIPGFLVFKRFFVSLSRSVRRRVFRQVPHVPAFR